MDKPRPSGRPPGQTQPGSLAWRLKHLNTGERTLVECEGYSLTTRMQHLSSIAHRNHLSGKIVMRGAILVELDSRNATDVVIVERLL